ncbi:MAG TPA: NAD(P)-dependent alcohol dehydrogenase [Anaerolineae bacterium]|nr:NAD(P)-dependent alcohol dehydrogenase [Anaerolineae bacterium]
MKALVYELYGTADVLVLQEVATPTPKAGEVLISVDAVGLNYADGAFLKGQPFVVRLGAGLIKPKNKILGADVAGRVTAIGSDVTQFEIGDEVFGDLSGVGFGGLAEYVCAPESLVAAKPANISLAEAAAVPMAAVTAWQCIQSAGGVKSGEKVLINGASGGVGTYMVQLAKVFGGEVTAVCSARNMEIAQSLGADHVIDYRQEDFTQNGKQYDLVIGVNGNRSLAEYKRVLAPQGRYICSGGSMRQIFQAILFGSFMSKQGGQTMSSMGVAKPSQKDLISVGELLKAGKIKPMIDKQYPLAQGADAFRYLGEGHAQGKIVITISN